MARIKVRDLSCEFVDAKPRDMDWSEGYSADDGEGWHSWEASACEKCGVSLVLPPGSGNEAHRYVDPTGESDCDGHVPTVEGPAMNYFYPCDWSDAEDAAQRIAHLPLCIVQLRDGTKGLALTGGGMDLSWEICEAYICLGFLPPRHYAGALPAQKAYSPECAERMRMVLAAARRTVSVLRGWLASDVRRLKGCADTLRGGARVPRRRKVRK